MATPKDKLVPAVTSIVSDLLETVRATDDVGFPEYLEIATRSPIVGPILDVLGYVAAASFGEYQHPDEAIATEIRSQFERMNGSLLLSVEEQFSAFAFGKAVSQWGVETIGGKLQLIDIQILRPDLYSFKGRQGRIEAVTFTGTTPETDIPYGRFPDGRILHTINQRSRSFRDPNGIPTLRRIVDVHRAWKLLMAAFLVAAHRQGTPILAGYVQSGAMSPLYGPDDRPLLDENGNEIRIPAAIAMQRQLEEVENQSTIVTDLANKIESLSQQSNGAIFIEGLKILQQLHFMGLLMPESVLTATGVGDSNLNTGHRSILMLVVRRIVAEIKEGLLEGPIRSIITWQFGEQEDYGSFTEPSLEDFSAAEYLDRLNNAFTTGWLQTSDLEAINAGRSRLGLSASDSTPTAGFMRRMLDKGANYGV